MFIKAEKSTFISEESDIKRTFDGKGGKYLLNIFFLTLRPILWGKEISKAEELHSCGQQWILKRTTVVMH